MTQCGLTMLSRWQHSKIFCKGCAVIGNAATAAFLLNRVPTLLHKQLLVCRALAAGQEAQVAPTLPDFQLREAEQIAGKRDKVESTHAQSNEQFPWNRCTHLPSRSGFQLHNGPLDTTAIIGRIKKNVKDHSQQTKINKISHVLFPCELWFQLQENYSVVGNEWENAWDPRFTWPLIGREMPSPALITIPNFLQGIQVTRLALHRSSFRRDILLCDLTFKQINNLAAAITLFCIPYFSKVCFPLWTGVWDFPYLYLFSQKICSSVVIFPKNYTKCWGFFVS